MKCFCVLKQKEASLRAEQAFEARKELKSDNYPGHRSSRSDNTPRHRASKSDNSPSRGPSKTGKSPSHRTSKVTDPRPSLRTIPEMYEQKVHNLTVFSYSVLKYATNGFNKLLKIGEGGFGCVYKGIVRSPDAQAEPPVVAIKKLARHGLQGHKQWLAEVQFLGVLEHPNLVKLLGHCSVDVGRYIERLLVYEYMPNKSLEDHLFNLALSPLPWKTRLQIMLGAAQGLAYLHEGLECQVIYRDFKSSNVLLDENFNPKLSDFGLARQGPTGDRSHVTTGVLGTYGYAAPEYLNTGRLSVKSDVWSFGVVLYEILTGRRAVERERPSPLERKLLDWVKYFPVNTDKFWGIIDRRLRNNYSLGAAREMGRLADRCVKENKNDRPTISEVVRTLKEAIKATEEEEGCSEMRISLSSSGVERVTSKEMTDIRPILSRCSSANSKVGRQTPEPH